MVQEVYSQHFVSSLSPSQAYSRGVESVTLTLPGVVMVEVPTGRKGRLVLLDVHEAKEDDTSNHCKNPQSGKERPASSAEITGGDYSRVSVASVRQELCMSGPKEVAYRRRCSERVRDITLSRPSPGRTQTRYISLQQEEDPGEPIRDLSHVVFPGKILSNMKPSSFSVLDLLAWMSSFCLDRLQLSCWVLSSFNWNLLDINQSVADSQLPLR
jgi:hypothetical protein